MVCIMYLCTSSDKTQLKIVKEDTGRCVGSLKHCKELEH